MDLITYALAKKAITSGGSGDAGILTKLENSVKEVQNDINQIQINIKPLLPLAQGAVLAIKISETPGEAFIELGENNSVLKLPLASGEVVGLVKSTPANSENSVNKISVHKDGTMEVNSLHIDKLVWDGELILDCSTILN